MDIRALKTTAMLQQLTDFVYAELEIAGRGKREMSLWHLSLVLMKISGKITFNCSVNPSSSLHCKDRSKTSLILWLSEFEP